MARDASLLAAIIRLASGVRTISANVLPPPPFVLFANHSSHFDFATIWAALPPSCRDRVRPVAGRDYWEKNTFRRWIALRVFNAVLIERQKVTVANNPLEPMLATLDTGDSLMVFPEGTRSLSGELQPFKSGLYHMAHARPAVPLVPVLLDNLNRILPKGEILAVPLIASVVVGTPMHLLPGETKPAFLDRARRVLAALRSP
jgi:1-acyl-sn-glycerol-3-phosphate acyltransferase